MRRTKQQTKRFNGKLRTKITEYTRETARVEQRNLIQTIQYDLYIGCAQRALLYKSIRTDRSMDTYFNAHK